MEDYRTVVDMKIKRWQEIIILGRAPYDIIVLVPRWHSVQRMMESH
jgi:hypothetical protein